METGRCLIVEVGQCSLHCHKADSLTISDGKGRDGQAVSEAAFFTRCSRNISPGAGNFKALYNCLGRQGSVGTFSALYRTETGFIVVSLTLPCFLFRPHKPSGSSKVTFPTICIYHMFLWDKQPAG